MESANANPEIPDPYVLMLAVKITTKQNQIPQSSNCSVYISYRDSLIIRRHGCLAMIRVELLILSHGYVFVLMFGKYIQPEGAY